MVQKEKENGFYKNSWNGKAAAAGVFCILRENLI